MVIAAKRGWPLNDDDDDDSDRKKMADDDRDSDRSGDSRRNSVRTSEYEELERLGLGKYDGAGRWVPSSRKKLYNKLRRFQ